METFKAGDKVYHTQYPEYGTGVVMEVTAPPGGVEIRAVVKWHHRTVHHQVKFLCKKHPETTKEPTMPSSPPLPPPGIVYGNAKVPSPPSKTKRSWSFKSVHKADIGFNEIKKDLTRKNPIALVEAGTECYVVLHESIIVKSELCYLSLREAHNILLPMDVIQYVSSKEMFASYVALVKKIKSLPWPEENRRKVVVTVTLPQV